MDAPEQPERRFEEAAWQLDELLRELASRRLARAGQRVSLRTSDLVQDAWLRILADRGADPADHRRFRVAAASAVRRAMLDHAKRAAAQKRGDGARRVTLETDLGELEDRMLDVLVLEEALEGLGALDPLLRRLVELLIYGGLTREEAAAELGLKISQLDGKWEFVKRWLKRWLRNLEA